MKLKDPPGEIAPLPKVLPVTVWGTAVLFFQITTVPAVIFSVCGLNAKLPLLSVVIVTTNVGTGVGVGVSFSGVGVGLGLETVGAAAGLDDVGVGLGRDDGGVSPVGIDVGDGADVIVVETV